MIGAGAKRQRRPRTHGYLVSSLDRDIGVGKRMIFENIGLEILPLTFPEETCRVIWPQLLLTLCDAHEINETRLHYSTVRDVESAKKYREVDIYRAHIFVSISILIYVSIICLKDTY